VQRTEISELSSARCHIFYCITMYQFTDPGHVSVMYFHHTSSHICHTVTLYWGEGAVSPST